ncbi:MAG: hypothetical protein V4659_07165 [Pseudomonadota bacterium]
MDDIAIDARLSALMGGADPTPDPVFVNRVARAIVADQALRTARARAWRRFRGEALATGALAAALAVLVWAVGDTPIIAEHGFTFGPAAAGLAMLLLWQVVEQRSAGAR